MFQERIQCLGFFETKHSVPALHLVPPRGLINEKNFIVIKFAILNRSWGYLLDHQSYPSHNVMIQPPSLRKLPWQFASPHVQTKDIMQ